MKKAILFGLAAILVVSIAFVGFFSMTRVKAESEKGEPEQQEEPEKDLNEQVKELLAGYINEDGQYTKLTTLATDNIAALGGSYHGGANAAQRRTYYDEKVNALLMGNYDGTFATINSGYAKAEKLDDMQHFTNNAGEIMTENLFSARDVNYTVTNTDPVDYFDVLSDLADKAGKSSKDDWTKTGGAYRYVTHADAGWLTGTDPYNDGLLKEFQYFASPMLLLNAELKLAKIELYESAFYPTGSKTTESVLVIKLLNADDVLISTALVVKGLTMQSDIAPAQVVLNGVAHDLVNNAGASAENLDKELMLPEAINVTFGDNIAFNMNGHREEIEGWDGDCVDTFYLAIRKAGKLKAYLKTWADTGNQTADIKIETENKVYLQPSNDWASSNARFAAYFYDGNGYEAWKDMTDEGNGWYSVEVDANANKVIFCRMNGATTENNWDEKNKWNQTSNLDINVGCLYIITGWNYSGKWA